MKKTFDGRGDQCSDRRKREGVNVVRGEDLDSGVKGKQRDGNSHDLR